MWSGSFARLLWFFVGSSSFGWLFFQILFHFDFLGLLLLADSVGFRLPPDAPLSRGKLVDGFAPISKVGGPILELLV